MLSLSAFLVIKSFSVGENAIIFTPAFSSLSGTAVKGHLESVMSEFESSWARTFVPAYIHILVTAVLLWNIANLLSQLDNTQDKQEQHKSSEQYYISTSVFRSWKQSQWGQ